MTSSDPEVIRQQIEDTRRELSYDVDALNEKVNPARVVDRRMTAAKGRVNRVKEKVMGSAHDTTARTQGVASNATGSVQNAASSAADSVQSAASTAVDTVQQTPDMIVRQTQGNPLAAGLIAFGVGWLVSSLLPATEKERQLAQQAETAVRENKDALLAPAKQVAQEIGDELKPAAQQAAQEVKATAQDAAQTVKDEGQSAAQDVKGQAQESKDRVQSRQGSSSSTI
jgi:vacuolar-type H+-ATPase subunit H